MGENYPITADVTRKLAQLLLAHSFLLPPNRVADDAAFLATSGADPDAVDVVRLYEIGQLVSTKVEPGIADAIAALSAELRESRVGLTSVPEHAYRSPPAPESQPSVRTVRPRPASLADAVVLTATAEFKPLMNEHAQEKFVEFDARLSASSPARDWEALSLFCGGLAAAIAGELTTPDRQLRLWQVMWWAVQRERLWGDHNRLSNRLNQLSRMLGSFPAPLRASLIAAHYNDFSVLVRANAKQQFLEWLAAVLEYAQDAEFRQLRSQCTIRLGELNTRTVPLPVQPAGQPELTAATPERLVEEFQDLWSAGSLSRDEAVDTITSGWIFLDAKKEAQNRERLDKARSSDSGGPAAQLAHGALRSALWRCRNRDTNQPDAFTPDHLRIAVALGRVVYQYSHPKRSDVVEDLTAIFGMTVLLWGLISPQSYIRFIDLLGETVRDEEIRQSVERAGADELLGYLTRSAGLQVLKRNPEPWVESASEWVSRYSGLDLERLLEVFSDADAQESLSLHTLRVGAVPSGDADSNSIFGQNDAAEFARHYQAGHLQPIAELLDRVHGRLLAVTEKDLSSVAHTEFLSPSGWVYIPGPDRQGEAQSRSCCSRLVLRGLVQAEYGVQQGRAVPDLADDGCDPVMAREADEADAVVTECRHYACA